MGLIVGSLSHYVCCDEAGCRRKTQSLSDQSETHYSAMRQGWSYSEITGKYKCPPHNSGTFHDPASAQKIGEAFFQRDKSIWNELNRLAQTYSIPHHELRDLRDTLRAIENADTTS